MSPAAFFAATFLMSWAIWLPLLLIRLGLLPPLVPVAALVPIAVLGVLMPSAAGALLTGRFLGRPGLRDLCRRVVRWRVGLWWAAALLIQPAVLVVAALIWHIHGSTDPVHRVTGLSLGGLFGAVISLLIASAGEEIGWRGVALSALQSRRGPVPASVILGLLVATWHLPYWALQGVLAQYGLVYLALDYLFVVALTFQLTWLVNHTRGSILIAVAFHVAFNTVNVAVLPVTSSTGAFAVLTLIECTISLSLIPWLALPVEVDNTVP